MNPISVRPNTTLHSNNPIPHKDTLHLYDRPVFFYALSLIIPWILWFAAAYLSNLSFTNRYLVIAQGILGIIGLLAPIGVAAYLFLQKPQLLSDLKQRLFRVSWFNQWYTVFALFFLFASILVAQLISIPLGYSRDQFIISGYPTFSSALFSPWFILLFAPIVEELAWHSYGTDSLLRRWNLFQASMIFGVYRAFWHFPLSFIEWYYHNTVMAEWWIHSLNFLISIFVFIIIMNWLYIKTNRNILITILFRLTANIANEIFATDPDSKVIQTGILLLVAITLIATHQNMFFNKKNIN